MPCKPILPILLSASLFAAACNSAKPQEQAQTKIPYPQPLPDTTAITFLPGIVSADSLDFDAAFAPDGQSFYFSRSLNGESKIYITHHKDGNWTAPEPAPFNGAKYSEADPAFAPNGNLYFISDRPTAPEDTINDYNIWFVKPQANGTWSAPENLQIVNSDSSEYYVSFAENGNLYFASGRAGGFGAEDIYVSTWENGQYTAPENLGAAINSAAIEYDPGVSPKEDMIVFASSNRRDTLGRADLYGAKVNKQGRWEMAVNLGPVINTKTRDFCPYFSPDGKYFFYSSEGNVKWISNDRLRAQL